MAAADTARLIASLELQDKNFTKNVDKAIGSLGKLGIKSQAIGTALGVGLEHLAERGAGLLVDAVKGGVQSLETLESATTSVDGAIKQMGLTGQVTSKQVADWANQIEDSVGAAFDDKAITASAATLLRYGKVTASNLQPALVVMTDLAAKTGSVDSAASLLAKALADPEKAAGKLARQGVILTKAQQDEIKAMVKAGDVAGAQRKLLDDLATATKGAADASQGPGQRAMSMLHDAFEDAQRALAEGLLPVINEVRDKLTTFLKDPNTIQRIRDFGKTLASGFRAIVDFGAKVPWGTIGSALKIAGTGAKAVLDAFVSMPAWVQTAVVTGWGLNKLSGGGLASIVGGGLKDALGKIGVSLFSKGGSPANPLYVMPVGGGFGQGAPGIPASGALGFLGAATGLTIAAGSIVALGEVIRQNINPNSSGDFVQQRAPNAYKAEFQGIFNAIKSRTPTGDAEAIDHALRSGFGHDVAGDLDAARQAINHQGQAAKAKLELNAERASQIRNAIRAKDLSVRVQNTIRITNVATRTTRLTATTMTNRPVGAGGTFSI